AYKPPRDSMSRTLLSLAGFQVIITGRFWVIAEAKTADHGLLSAVCLAPSDAAQIMKITCFLKEEAPPNNINAFGRSR
ncbi:MAG: hypothetical protein WBP52_10395, partial [Terriglobales bacterium]